MLLETNHIHGWQVAALGNIATTHHVQAASHVWSKGREIDAHNAEIVGAVVMVLNATLLGCGAGDLGLAKPALWPKTPLL
eukprot:15458346-Alexandrium_andersonii.AAC.1